MVYVRQRVRYEESRMLVSGPTNFEFSNPLHEINLVPNFRTSVYSDCNLGAEITNFALQGNLN